MVFKPLGLRGIRLWMVLMVAGFIFNGWYISDRALEAIGVVPGHPRSCGLFYILPIIKSSIRVRVDLLTFVQAYS